MGYRHGDFPPIDEPDEMNPLDYVVVFLLVAVLGMGIPGPGDASLIAAGTAAGEGRLNIWVAVGIGAAAWAVGSLLGYEFGSHQGRGLLEHPGRLGKLRRSLLTKGEHMFGEHDVIASATLPAFLSGVFKVRPGAFAIGTVTAGIFWVGSYLFVSYFLGADIARAIGDAGTKAIVGVVVVVVIGIAIKVGWARWRSRKGVKVA